MSVCVWEEMGRADKQGGRRKIQYCDGKEAHGNVLLYGKKTKLRGVTDMVKGGKAVRTGEMLWSGGQGVHEAVTP